MYKTNIRNKSLLTIALLILCLFIQTGCTAPAENTPADNAPAENAPADNAPAENAPADNTPAEDDNMNRLTINDKTYEIYDIIVAHYDEQDYMEIQVITRIPGFENTLPRNPRAQEDYCKDFPVWCQFVSGGGTGYYTSKMEFRATDTPGEIAAVYYSQWNMSPKSIRIYETGNPDNGIQVTDYNEN